MWEKCHLVFPSMNKDQLFFLSFVSLIVLKRYAAPTKYNNRNLPLMSFVENSGFNAFTSLTRVSHTMELKQIICKDLSSRDPSRLQEFCFKINADHSFHNDRKHIKRLVHSVTLL